MFIEPQGTPDFSKLEDAVTQWWKDNSTFEESISHREGQDQYIFYDGPPFITGIPHYGSILSSISKDAVPRYQTMKGKQVERVWGWDCHGLPIEEKVEKQMGLSGRKEINENLEQFIEKCYEWNRVGFENWKWYVEKVGRWVDMDNAYRTMDQDYMESVWWVFKQIWEKNLVYKGRRTSMFSTDSSTPVSSFEVSMDADNYKDTEDIAVTIRFELEADSQVTVANKLGITADKPIYMLAWTTTPWTLPSNFALAVNPKADYIAFEEGGKIHILAKDLAESAIGKKDLNVVGTLKPKDLKGLKYKQLYNYLKGGKNDFQVYISDYVTIEDGTGVLHVAPAFGEEDFNMGQEWKLSFESDIDDAGMMLVGPWKGTYLRDANPLITEELDKSGKLYKQEKYVHRLPYYRYDNPLIYKTQESYFVNVQKLKETLYKSNEEIRWIPDHFKEGRFKYILETAPDWSISRSRFWGTVMPVWANEDGDEIVVGSRDELMSLVNASDHGLKIRKLVLSLGDSLETTADAETAVVNFIKGDSTTLEIAASQEILSYIRYSYCGETEQESQVKPIAETEQRAYYLANEKPLDLHRPYIDDVTFKQGDKLYKRVEYTLDVWMDSGSMPFAQFHYPFMNTEKFEASFPGDFIAEYTGQIRAWFYVLHVIANAVFEKPSFKNVLVTGVLAGTDGRKMSKSYGNYPDPKETLEKYGGDALRLYLLESPLLQGNDTNFNEDELKMQVREFLIPLWNSYKYLVTYANIHEWSPSQELAHNDRSIWNDEHEWDHMPFDGIENELDAWVLLQLQNTIGEVTAAMDEYHIPRAISNLKSFINELSKWYIRRSRDRFVAGETMAMQVLYYVLVEFTKLAAPITPFIAEHIYQRLVTDKSIELPESVHLTDFPVVDVNFVEQYQALAPEMQVVREIAELGQMIRTENGLKVRQPLAKLEVQFSLKDDAAGIALAPWMARLLQDELNIQEVVEVPKLAKSDTILNAEKPAQGISVGLETALTPELEAEGLMREVIRTIQSMRKKAGFQLGEQVSVTYQTDSKELQQIMEARGDEIAQAVSASSIAAGEATETSTLNGHNVAFALE